MKRLLLIITLPCVVMAADSFPYLPTASFANTFEQLATALRTFPTASLSAEEQRIQAAAAQDATGGALLALAEIADLRNDRPAADASIQRALALPQATVPTLTGIAALLVIHGKPAEAETVLRRALGIAPNDLAATFALADLYISQLKRPADGLKLTNDIIAREPANGPAHLRAAIALAQQTQRDRSIAEMQLAMRYENGDPTPSYELGRLYQAISSHDRAVDAFTHSLSIRKDQISALGLRGESYIALKNYPAAIADLRMVAAANPRNPAARVRIGMIFEQTGDVDGAIVEYKAAVEIDPKQYVALNNLASIASSRGSDLDNALTWAKAAAALQPANPPVLDTLAWVYHARTEDKEALTVYQRIPASAISTLTGEILYHWGVVAQEAGDADTARRQLQAAVGKNQDFPGIDDALSRLRGLTLR